MPYLRWFTACLGVLACLAAIETGWALPLRPAAGAYFSQVVVVQSAPDAAELEAYTGLHEAAARGDMAAAERLIKSGADLNGRDSNGRTPLMVAAYRRNQVMARLLIKAGANLNALDKQAYDVLTISAVLDDVGMVRLAIKAGANTGLITSPYKGTALIAAAHLGHDGVVAALVAGKAPLDHVNNLNWTALIEAIVLGNGGPRHIATVKVLVDAGARLDLPDGNGVTPLRLALSRGYKEIAAILEKAGAKP